MSNSHSQRHNLYFILVILLVVVFTLVSSDLSSDRQALLSLRSAVGGRTLLWNTSNPTPCTWAGVNCAANRVTVLRLPGVSLNGNIPAGIFSNLTALRTLSLRLNALSGPLPADLAACVTLRNLYLQGNLFSGDIPEFLYTLPDLVRLNLADNNFSGEISPEFKKLKRLRTLYLENNRLNGTIPLEVAELPKLQQFNVSNNVLNGSIPVKLRSYEASSFLGNSLCGGPLGVCPAENGGFEEKKKKRKLSGGAIAGIVIGCVVGFVVLFLLCCKKKKSASPVDVARTVPAVKPMPQEVEVTREKLPELESGGNGNVYAAVGNVKSEGSSGGAKKLVFFGNGPRVFDLEDLLRASAEVLGKGTFGTAYKAVLETGTVVAVKRLKDVIITEKEFKEKIESVGAMDHENLVPLRAYYFIADEKLLVYDYMAMGSLSALLHGNKGAGRTPLNWELRSGIALGAARGIEYLHSQGPNISHGNIKSSNILLTKSYEGRVSDFGLAHLVGPSSTPNRVAGYRAPEVTDPRKVSQKADVYSFGVLLLELLTGKPPTHALLNEEGVDLPRWVQSIVKEEWTSEVFDLELLRYQNVEEEMVQLLQLAIDCSEQYPDKRPSIYEVTRRIEELRRSTLREDQPGAVHDIDDGSSR